MMDTRIMLLSLNESTCETHEHVQHVIVSIFSISGCSTFLGSMLLSFGGQLGHGGIYRVYRSLRRSICIVDWLILFRKL